MNKRQSTRRPRRFERIQRSTATADTRGTISITVTRRAEGRHAPGNISRSITVRDAKVSEVADAIALALFDGTPETAATA